MGKACGACGKAGVADESLQDSILGMRQSRSMHINRKNPDPKMRLKSRCSFNSENDDTMRIDQEGAGSFVLLDKTGEWKEK